MSVYSHDPEGSLDPVRWGLSYSYNKMKANEMAAPFASIFGDLRKENDVTRAKEVALNDERSETRARVHAFGEDVVDIANRLSKQVLILTGDQRKHPLYTLFFGDATFGDFKKPLLLGDFEGVRGWELALEKTPHDSLKAFAEEWKALIALADEAVKARDGAEHAWKVFREVGERMQFFNKVNAARKTVHGELSKLPFEHVGLPRNFADRFFTHRRWRKKTSNAEPTVDSVKEELEQLEAETVAKKQLLQELTAAAEEAKKEEAAQAAELAAIEALEKQAAEIAAQAAKKKAKLAAAEKKQRA